MPNVGWVDEPTASLLTNVIDTYVEGIIEARQLTMEDPTIESAEQFLDLLSGYDEDMARLQVVRRRLS